MRGGGSTFGSSEREPHDARGVASKATTSKASEGAVKGFAARRQEHLETAPRLRPRERLAEATLLVAGRERAHEVATEAPLEQAIGRRYEEAYGTRPSVDVVEPRIDHDSERRRLESNRVVRAAARERIRQGGHADSKYGASGHVRLQHTVAARGYPSILTSRMRDPKVRIFGAMVLSRSPRRAGAFAERALTFAARGPALEFVGAVPSADWP